MSTERDEAADVTPQAEKPAPEAEAAGDDTTGDVIGTVMDGLASHGLDVRSPEWDGAHILKMTHVPGILCEVAIYDSGSVVWEYRMLGGAKVDPVHVTSIAMSILGASFMESDAALVRKYSNLTLKGRAGLALAERGMEVSLEVYTDEIFFDAYSEIEVTNPEQPGRGTLRIADDESFRWDCRLKGVASDATGIDPQDFVETIAKSLVR
jgi:hypothetical protein